MKFEEGKRYLIKNLALDENGMNPFTDEPGYLFESIMILTPTVEERNDFMQEGEYKALLERIDETNYWDLDMAVEYGTIEVIRELVAREL